MKLRAILSALSLIVLMGAGISSAQDDCGNGLPCGPIPWPVPDWPELSSPTPIGELDYTYLEITPTPTMTLTPIPTVTPIPTATPLVTAQYLDDAIATAAAEAEVTAEVDFMGTDVPDAVVGLGDNTELFSYAKGLVTNNTFGVFTPIVNLFLLFFGVSMFFSLVTLGIWAVKILVQIVINIVNLILKFIPLFG